MGVDMQRFVEWLVAFNSGRRTPHWLLLAVASLSFAGGFYAFLQNVDVTPLVDFLHRNVLVTRLLVALPVFFTLYCLLLMHFNARDSRAKSSLIELDGVLRFERVEHIAIRIATLKNILKSLVDGNADPESARKALFNAGQIAGESFGSRFEDIYLSERMDNNHNRHWANLKPRERLRQWVEFDRGVGWGDYSPIFDEKGPRVTIEIVHPTLFTQKEGELVADFMAGYATGVAKQILHMPQLHCTERPTVAVDHSSLTVHLGKDKQSP